MSDQSIYIPSGGIGETEFIPEEKNWYKTESVWLTKIRLYHLWNY